MNVTQAPAVTVNEARVLTQDNRIVESMVADIQVTDGAVLLQTPALSGSQGDALVRSLVGAASRVPVQVILHARGTSDATLQKLREGGIDVRLSHAPSDGSTLLVTGGKAAHGGRLRADEVNATAATVRFRGPAVGALVERFDAEWRRLGGTPAAHSRLEVPPSARVRTRIWSAQEGRERLMYLIRHARQSIWMESHGLNDPQIMRALKDARDRGVTVNVILERSTSDFSRRPGAVDNLPAAINFSDPLSGLPFRWSSAPLDSQSALFDGEVAIVSTGGLTEHTSGVVMELSDTSLALSLKLQFIQDWQKHSTEGRVTRPTPFRQ